MNLKKIKLFVAGILTMTSICIFMQNLYEFSSHSLLGIMFGSVNYSIWELTRTVAFPYTIWGIIEMLSIKCHFRRFIVARTISLCVLAVSFIALMTFIRLILCDTSSALPLISALLCWGFSIFLSSKLYNSSKKLEVLFCPTLFLLLFLLALYLCFTTFPPKFYIFKDPQTSLYGIIPENIDLGAIALDSFYTMRQ